MNKKVEPIIDMHDTWLAINTIQGCTNGCKYCFLQGINNHIENFYREISEKKTDILGISNIYFKSHRKDIEWTSLDYKISTNLKINNAGLIFEVNK